MTVAGGSAAEGGSLALKAGVSSKMQMFEKDAVELLRDLQKRHDLAYLFISHDLKVVRAMAHEIMVMRRGRVVEQGPADDIFNDPKDPYTRALMAAAFWLPLAPGTV